MVTWMICIYIYSALVCRVSPYDILSSLHGCSFLPLEVFQNDLYDSFLPFSLFFMCSCFVVSDRIHHHRQSFKRLHSYTRLISHLFPTYPHRFQRKLLTRSPPSQSYPTRSCYSPLTIFSTALDRHHHWNTTLVNFHSYILQWQSRNIG